ncbi:MAG: RnfABCDGE type electron transport complex subunit G [Pseudomonadota bacterium]|nr:MAG: RnfABCDGE type electron transport complex subunit G [Pseudomonadota bacterium]
MADRSLLQPAMMLVAAGLAAAVILAGLNELTDDRIEREQQRRALAAVSAMLEADSYDNDLAADTARLRVPGLAHPATVHLARSGGVPASAVIDVVTSRGYSGDIRLLLAVDMDGTVLGVRVIEHRETPGLGDRIERGKSDWIEQFAGRSLGDPPDESWAPDRRGGTFDTLSSATITSAAVIDAIKRALQAFEADKDALFERAVTGNPEDS